MVVASEIATHLEGEPISNWIDLQAPLFAFFAVFAVKLTAVFGING